MSDPRISADGFYYWDGAQWVPRQGLPAQAPAPYRQAPYPTMAPARLARVPTSWTLPLQYAVTAAFALWGLYSITIPFWMSGVMNGYMRQIALQQATQAPEVYPDPNQYADMMSSVATMSLWFGVVIGAAISIVVIIGALKRWTWLFYAVMVLLLLEVAGLPFQIASAFGAFNSLTPAMALPSYLTWISVVSGLISLGLGAWMLIALLTRGPWGMRRPS